MIDAVDAVGMPSMMEADDDGMERRCTCMMRDRGSRGRESRREPADGIEYVHHSKPTYGADDDARQFLRYENTLVINTTISDFDFPQTHSPMGILIINKYT